MLFFLRSLRKCSRCHAFLMTAVVFAVQERSAEKFSILDHLNTVLIDLKGKQINLMLPDVYDELLHFRDV